MSMPIPSTKGILLGALGLITCIVIFSGLQNPISTQHRQASISHLAIPSEAYFITLPDKGSFTAIAKSEVARLDKAVGPLNLRVVFGTYNGTFGNVNQLGLSLAHLHIWDDILARNLTAAWVFEDDVIFHDNIEELFPLYWDQVPADFEVIYLGHNPTLPQHLVACEEPGSQRFFHEHSVYTTHAMIISYNGALRLSRAMHGLLNMSKRIKRTPHEYELKIDLFFNYVRETFLQPYEYSKWIAFDSTPEHPAQWGGVPWCRTPDLFDAIIFHHYPMDCCETCNVADVRNATKHPVPLVGTGLAYQHWCKHDSMALNRWRI